jgi:hypothetical protein
MSLCAALPLPERNNEAQGVSCSFIAENGALLPASFDLLRAFQQGQFRPTFYQPQGLGRISLLGNQHSRASKHESSVQDVPDKVIPFVQPGEEVCFISSSSIETTATVHCSR